MNALLWRGGIRCNSGSRGIQCRTALIRLSRIRTNATAARNFDALHSSLTTPPATPLQLRRHFWISAVPFVGFGEFSFQNNHLYIEHAFLIIILLYSFITGFMDNTVMIQAGNAIDCTIGVMLGLSTLAAAAIGQIISSGVSVTFGGYVEGMARQAGLPSAGFTSAQRQLKSVRRFAMFGQLFGVVVGATLGLVNLALIDTNRSTHLKLEALTEEQEFAFEVEASNTKRNDASVLTVKGPDVDGLLASMTEALAESGYTLVELHASPRSTGYIEDVFVVRPRGQKRGQMDDGELDDLARKLLAASRDPLSAHTLKTEVQKLRAKNQRLRDRVNKLIHKLEDQHITIETAAATAEEHVDDDENEETGEEEENEDDNDSEAHIKASL